MCMLRFSPRNEVENVSKELLKLEKIAQPIVVEILLKT
jgi:hypothetical protein